MMNQRIQELIVRLEPDAFMTYKGYLYHSGDPKVLEHSDPEPLYIRQELVKFAELIVLECADIPTLMWGTSEVNADVAVKIRNRILEHFGVEE